MEKTKFKIIIVPSVQRTIESLETKEALRLVKDIKAYLETEPLGFRKTRIKKLTDFKPPLYRLRSGNLRAYYRIVGREVVVLAVTDKKDSERLLKRLK